MSVYIKDQWAKLWEVKPAEKYVDLRISTSEKDKDGKYINSTWFPRVWGNVAEQFKHMQAGDRFKIASGRLSNVSKQMEDGTYRTRLEFKIFAIGETSGKNADVQGNPVDGGEDMLRIIELFDRLNSGGAKEVFREAIDGGAFEQAFRRHSTWKTKAGKEAKKYKFSDCMAILRECEAIIKQSGIEDLDNIVKVMNYYEATGTFGYYTGLEEDRPKLFVKEVYPVCRKSDNRQFGYSIITQSLGSGKESRFTVFNRVFDKDPIQKNDLILCKHYAKDGPYFQLDSYAHIY